MARAVHTLTDELDFYCDCRDIGTVLTVTATSTQTVNSATLQQTGQGAIFYISPNPIVATCTVRLNITANDPASGRLWTVASISLDGLSVTTTGNPLTVLYVTPQPASGVSGASVVIAPMPRNFRVQASITVINATSTSAAALTVGMTRLGVI